MTKKALFAASFLAVRATKRFDCGRRRCWRSALPVGWMSHLPERKRDLEAEPVGAFAQQGRSRRRAAGTAVVAIGALGALAACGSSGGGGNGGSPGGSGGSSSKPTVIMGTTDTPVSYDPAGSYDLPSWTGIYNVYQGLLKVPAGTSKIEPDAATCKFSNPTTYVCTLKPGQTFSNGDPVTGEDVVYSFDRILKIKDAS